MARFNPFEATRQGFITAWAHRMPIARHALNPILIKCGALAAVLFLGLEDNFLRQGLVLLPAFFAEGFFVAFILHSVLLRKDFSTDIRDIDMATARDLMASMIVYVLIKLVLALIVGLTFLYMPDQAQMVISEAPSDPPIEPPAPHAGVVLGSLFLMGFSLWAFRLLWLYIPLALGQGFKDFWRDARGFNTSFYMIGCWLFCLLPFGFAMMLYMNFILSMIPVPDGGDPSLAAKLLIVIGQGIIELALIVVSSLAMAFGLRMIREN